MESKFERLLDPIIYTLRFNDKKLQKAIFQKVIESTPASDLAFLKALIENIVAYAEHRDPTIRESVEVLVNHSSEFLSDAVIEDRMNLEFNHNIIK